MSNIEDKTRLCIIGSTSSVAMKFSEYIRNSKDEDALEVIHVGRSSNNSGHVPDIELDIKSDSVNQLGNIPLDCEYYFISLGVLYPKNIVDMNVDDIHNSMSVNLLFPVLLCETILKSNPDARMVVIGSESGQKGSYDTTYFLAKSALEAYVRERYLEYPDQQIVMIAPSVIYDTKMTRDRHDLDVVDSRAKLLPKMRYLFTDEVVSLAYYLLFEDKGYITNEIISMNGGKFARMKYPSNK